MEVVQLFVEAGDEDTVDIFMDLMHSRLIVRTHGTNETHNYKKHTKHMDHIEHM